MHELGKDVPLDSPYTELFFMLLLRFVAFLFALRKLD